MTKRLRYLILCFVYVIINQTFTRGIKMKLYEKCLRCGRKLKSEESKSLGYGKVCYEKSHTLIHNKLFEIGGINENKNGNLSNDLSNNLSNEFSPKTK